MSNKTWWELMPNFQVDSMCLPVLRQMQELEKFGAPVFRERKFVGLIDCMELTSLLVKSWSEYEQKSEAVTKHLLRRGSAQSGSKDRKNTAIQEPFRLIAAEFGYASVLNCLRPRNSPHDPMTTAGKKNVNDKAAEPIICAPCYTNQFVFNIIHKFASGQRCVAICKDSEKNIVHVMTQAEIAEWLARRLNFLGDKIGKPLFQLLSVVRRPFTVEASSTAKDAFHIMTKHRCDALAIVNEGEEFVDEIHIEDIRWMAREREIDAETDPATAHAVSNSTSMSPLTRKRSLISPKSSPSLERRTIATSGPADSKSFSRRITSGAEIQSGSSKKRISAVTRPADESLSMPMLLERTEADERFFRGFADLLLPVIEYARAAKGLSDFNKAKRKERELGKKDQNTFIHPESIDLVELIVRTDEEEGKKKKKGAVNKKEAAEAREGAAEEEVVEAANGAGCENKVKESSEKTVAPASAAKAKKKNKGLDPNLGSTCVRMKDSLGKVVQIMAREKKVSLNDDGR